MALDAFRDTIKKFEFAQSAQLWPHYIPIYYYKEKFDGHPSEGAQTLALFIHWGGDLMIMLTQSQVRVLH
jgi:hypothetical protein